MFPENDPIGARRRQERKPYSHQPMNRSTQGLLWAKPIVAPDLGGPSEMIEPAVSGLLIRPNDSVALAD